MNETRITAAEIECRNNAYYDSARFRETQAKWEAFTRTFLKPMLARSLLILTKKGLLPKPPI